MNSLIQWNLNGFYSKIIDLKLLVNNLKPSIICLQETNLKPNHNATLKNYLGYFRERQTNPNRASGGVAILVKNNIKSSPIPINSELEVIATRIQLHHEITICNIYLPDSIIFSYQQIINIIKQLPSPYIMVGDFNSRNTNWGCNHTDPRGKIIEKIIDDENVTLLNNGTFTHHNSSRGTFSAIDLSLASSSISPYLSWEVKTDYFNSDHWPILIKIHHRNSPQTPYNTNKWTLRNPNWTLYSDLIDKTMSENLILNNELNTDDIDIIVKQFTSIITEAAHKSIGKTIIHPKKTPVPWWSNECNNAIKNYKKALNRYKKTKTVPDHINLKKAKALSRRIIKHQKTESWKKLINDLTPNTPIKEAWKKIRLIEGIQFNDTPQTLTKEGKIFFSSLEKAEALAEVFEKNSSDENYSPDFRNSKSKNETENPITISEDENHPINLPINIQELFDALYKCNSKNSTGHDEIPYIFIKQLPISAISILLKIYNLIWEKRTFPTSWKIAIIIPILKPNKDRHEVTSYRPISLICTLSKLLEKIVSKRLYWTLKQTNFISKQQFGFQRNKSTIDALTIITEDIYSAFNIKQHVLLTSLDIEKAYDMVWRHRILDILQKNKINGNTLAYISNFLSKRSFSVKLNETHSSNHNLQNGIPQGSSLSVTLFIIAINELPSIIPPPLKTIMFADDSTIYCKGRNINTSKTIMQNAINEISKWEKSTGFKFGPEKSKSILFTYKTNKTPPQIYMNNILIPPTYDLKMLGLNLNNQLNWSKHIKLLKTKTKLRLNIIRAISNRAWGANSTIIMRTYKSLILSVIDYGSIIYGAAPESILKSLDPIHNQGIRLSIGAFKTSPIPSILCEANTPPLEIRRNLLIHKFALKRLADKDNAISPYLFNTSPPSFHLRKNQPISTRIKKWLDTTNTTLPKLLSPDPYRYPPWKMNLNINTSMIQEIQNIEPSEIPKHFNDIILKNFCDHKIIYTDGSKSNIKTGLAIITDEETFKFSSLEINSIFTIEALAILKAIELTEQNWKNTKSFLIASDSLSSILAIQNQGTSNEIIKNIQERASSLAPRSVTFMWIPAHKNIPGNEKADIAAKEASTNINIPKIDLSSLKDTARNALKSSKMIHQRLWDQELNNKLYQIKPFLIPNPNPPSSTRRQQVIWTRMKIGHTNITHIHLMRREPRPNCELCNNAPISTAHLLLECPNLIEQRKIFPHLTLRDILSIDNFNYLITFLKITNLYNRI